MPAGPWHYSEAEKILTDARHADPDADHGDVALLLKFAAVHATLAQTAAIALQTAIPLIGDDQQVTDWCKAIGVTFSIPAEVRITDALAQIDELDQHGLISPGSARKLREALGATGGEPA